MPRPGSSSRVVHFHHEPGQSALNDLGGGDVVLLQVTHSFDILGELQDVVEVLLR